jgi:membrane dipeptidase (peptidase family M19)
MKNVPLVLALLFAVPLHAADSKKLDAEVAAITKSALLIDTHNDIPSFTVSGADIANAPKNHTDIPRLKQGGVGAVFFSVYVTSLTATPKPSSRPSPPPTSKKRIATMKSPP